MRKLLVDKAGKILGEVEDLPPGSISCPYCGTVFPSTGKPELQECPRCHSKLLV